MPPALELAKFLADEQVTGAHGGAEDWSAHVSREPENPDDVVTLYDTGGLEPLSLDGPDMGQPQVQVRVRAREYEAGYSLQKAIRAALVQPDAALGGAAIERTIGESRYVTISPIGDILAIGRDEADRHIFTANYQVIRQAEGGT
jgi:hypothetical protein